MNTSPFQDLGGDSDDDIKGVWCQCAEDECNSASVAAASFFMMAGAVFLVL